jgi:hypothetical protein
MSRWARLGDARPHGNPNAATRTWADSDEIGGRRHVFQRPTMCPASVGDSLNGGFGAAQSAADAPGAPASVRRRQSTPI